MSPTLGLEKTSFGGGGWGWGGGLVPALVDGVLFSEGKADMINTHHNQPVYPDKTSNPQILLGKEGHNIQDSTGIIYPYINMIRWCIQQSTQNTIIMQE